MHYYLYRRWLIIVVLLLNVNCIVKCELYFISILFELLFIIFKNIYFIIYILSYY